MIPKYRHMHYTDEGCDLYQCLSCYKQMEFRYCPEYNFCPICGVKWEGKLECRESHNPRWVYELGVSEDEQYNFRAKAYYKAEVKRCWIIEKRTVFWNSDGKFYTYKEHPGAQDWHIDHKYPGKTAKEVMRYLKIERSDSRQHDPPRDWSFGSYDEFRARIGDKDE